MKKTFDASGWVQVAFAVPLRQAFTYRLPKRLKEALQPGVRCLAPFGRTMAVGVVLSKTMTPPPEGKEAREVAAVLDDAPLWPEALWKLLLWMSEYYHAPVGEVLFGALPVFLRRPPRLTAEITEGGARHGEELKILEPGRPRGGKITAAAGEVWRISLHRYGQALVFQDRGWLRLRWEDRPPSKETPEEPSPKEIPQYAEPVLNAAQQEAVFRLQETLDGETFQPFLLYGVTGSGKTEVYLNAAKRCLEKGKTALILLPEIALTPQTVQRFQARLGRKVALVHSRLSAKDREREWLRLKNGAARVAVGARSVLFAPLERLGLIVVDEEHDTAYKQEESPRYHARDAALKLGQLSKCTVVLGSATPSLETWWNVQQGKIACLRLPERAGGAAFPKVQCVDLREETEIRGRDFSLLSFPLQEALRETIAQGEQALLFLNRRGFHTVTLCAKCGVDLRCPSCDVALTRHRKEEKEFLLCHYCNHRQEPPAACSACGGDLLSFGFGLQRLEEEVRHLFPQVTCARLDADTVRSTAKLEDLLERFRRGEVQVLLGTQMAAKGHDFPGLTLVGVVGADVGMALPDFRAAERVFQLLVQVSGRAGRAKKPGRLFLQSFRVDHPVIQFALRRDLEGFYRQELEWRRRLRYPPALRMVLLLYRSVHAKDALQAAEKHATLLRGKGFAGLEALGPAPAPIARLRGYYRFQLFLKSSVSARLHEAVRWLEASPPPKRVQWVVDVDPQQIL